VSANFQRKGAISNTHAGREFELAAQLYFRETGIHLQSSFPVPIGYSFTKVHKFDLGSDDPPVLVECKSYTWTETGNSPSAKIKGMNEVMLLFSVCPTQYRRVLFLLKHVWRGTSLASHYVKTQGHLIGPNIEIWEFDTDLRVAERIL
jgi:hypothetical protein